MAKKKATRKKTSGSAQVPSIRVGISDIVNELNVARMRTRDPQEALEIQRIIRILFILWEYVIYEQMNKQSADYKSAISKLTAARKAAEGAVVDMQKTAAAIKKATEAAKAIDKIVKLAIKVI